ncbi:MAG: TonB-dependent receptor plug domain-containing protein [Balneolaceae bacterium]|nr:TonB-dependent receptor plug domain-containing protein [Balneolaceae bacterium]
MKTYTRLFCTTLIVALLVGCGSMGSTNRSDDADFNRNKVQVNGLAEYLQTLPKIRVRGNGSSYQVYNSMATSISQDTRVLFVVNGVQMGRSYDRAISSLNRNDYVEVKFLRMSRATLLYGEAGRNGVLQIDTASG